MDLLVSFDENYLPQLRVLLVSLYQNDPGVRCRVHLLHRAISQGQIDQLREDVEKLGWELCPVTVDGRLFANAPATKQYPQEMYYRLLAGQLLPKEVKRVLYLDLSLIHI